MAEYVFQGRILYADGREAEIDDGALVSMVIEEGADGALLPGAVLSAGCTLELDDRSGAWASGGALIGATLAPALRSGEDDIPLGFYRIESAVCDAAAGLLRVKGADALSFEAGGSFTDGLSYPATLAGIMRAAVAQTRFDWDGAMPCAAALIDLVPEWGEITLRRALSLIACAAGGFVDVDRTGALRLRRVWDPARAAFELDAGDLISLDADDARFGSADALELTPTVAADAEDAPEGRTYYTSAHTRVYPLSVSENPLLRSDAPHLDAVAQGMLNAVAGYATCSMKMKAVGVPSLYIGAPLRVTDADGNVHTGVLTRRTLRYDGALTDELSCRAPEADDSGVMRVFTKEGGLNAAALAGTVDGGLLSARSVTAAKLAAGSVTAEKLSAGSVTAEKIAAGAVDAGALSAVTAKLGALTAQNIAADALGAALIRASVLTAGAGSFDAATVKHLISSVFNLNGTGAMADVFIENLKVRSAQLVSATLGTLILRASDGRYYRMDVSGGQATATDVTDSLTAGEIAAGLSADRRAIVETSIAADELSASNFKAQTALVNRVYAAAIDCGTLCAREGFIDELRALRLSPSAGNSLTLGALADDFERAMQLTSSGADFYVDIGQIARGNVARIDESGLKVLVGGQIFSRFDARSARFGEYELRKSADGGLVFRMAAEG